METSIPSNVFPLRPLESFQVILSPASLRLFPEDIGRDLEIFVLEPANRRCPERRWFLHPSVCHRENILHVASEHVMLAGGVCLACVPPLPNNSPDRAWPDSAPPLGMPSTLVEWGVMRLLRSIFVEMRPESTSSSPIFGKEMPGMLDSVGDHSLEQSPRPLQFYLYKGVAHRREGSPSPYFTFCQACLYVGGAVSSLVFV